MINYYTLIFIIHSTISSHQVWNPLPTYRTLLQLHPCSPLQEVRCCTHRVSCVRICNATPMTTCYMIHGPSLAASLWIPTGQRKWQSCRADHVNNQYQQYHRLVLWNWLQKHIRKGSMICWQKTASHILCSLSFRNKYMYFSILHLFNNTLNSYDYTLSNINKIQQDATVCRYLFTPDYSTCFGCPSHPSSGVHKTLTAASGTGHITYVSSNLPPAWPN